MANSHKTMFLSGKRKDNWVWELITLKLTPVSRQSGTCSSTELSELIQKQNIYIVYFRIHWQIFRVLP